MRNTTRTKNICGRNKIHRDAKQYLFILRGFRMLLSVYRNNFLSGERVFAGIRLMASENEFFRSSCNPTDNKTIPRSAHITSKIRKFEPGMKRKQPTLQTDLKSNV
ncbi:hypothetical protein CEXT_494711 [Caerostris extrusa]|uniref:Uncharacterized protein n=1 Tax=Caerostris extrusa TaxID=172846 RepID=A0AAV4NB23_CAEEX|nr:hypothetical protein CEXT_494711 [Caerostris extrusa]